MRVAAKIIEDKSFIEEMIMREIISGMR